MNIIRQLNYGGFLKKLNYGESLKKTLNYGERKCIILNIKYNSFCDARPKIIHVLVKKYGHR